VCPDDIFLPKEVESARMDDFEREIEEFKRLAVFCVLHSTVTMFASAEMLTLTQMTKLNCCSFCLYLNSRIKTGNKVAELFFCIFVSLTSFFLSLFLSFTHFLNHFGGLVV